MRFGAGWQGWTAKQCLRQDLNYLTAAWEGRIEMLQAIFGKGDDKEKPPPQEQPGDQQPPLPLPPQKQPADQRPFYMPDKTAPLLTASVFDKVFSSKVS